MTTALLTMEEKTQVGRKSPWWIPPEPIGRSDIRRFAEATFNRNPVHQDMEYAKRTRWGTIVAPPTFVMRPPYGGTEILGPTARTIGEVSVARAPRAVNAGNEVEIFRPVRVGEEVRQRARIADLVDKTGRNGPFVLLLLETVYANEMGEVLGIGRYSTIRLPGREDHHEPGTPAPQTSLPPSSIQHGQKTPSVSLGARPLVFERVEAGQELPVNDYGIITSEMMVRYSSAAENYEALHHDFLFCVERGFQNVLVNGPLRNGLLGTYLEQLAGDDGFVRRMTVSQRGMDHPGHVLKVQGVITRKEIGPDGLGIVEVDAWVENQKGERTCPGSATILLPRRGGPPVPASFACPRDRVTWAFEAA